MTSAASAAVTASDDNEAEKICSICLETLPEKGVVRLPCSHAFCSSCVEKWRSKYDANSQRTCPHCRAPLPPTKEMVAQLKAYRLMIDDLRTRLYGDPTPIEVGETFTDDIPEPLRTKIQSMGEQDPVSQQQLLRIFLQSRLESSEEQVAEIESIVGDAEVLLHDDSEGETEDLPPEIDMAAGNNEVETVLEWLGPPPVPAKRINAKWQEKFHRTLLHEAEFEGNIGLMTLLLQMGAKVDPQSAFGMTPFQQTCLNDWLEDASRLLLAWGAETNKLSPDGTLPYQDVLKHAKNKRLATLLQTPLGGRRCEIVALQKRMDLNGKTGIAERYLPKKERYEVVMEKTGERIAVRPANLKRRDRTPQDCGKFTIYRGRAPNGENLFELLCKEEK